MGITRRRPLGKPGRNGFKYREQYGVVVLCKNERHQARVYNVLRRRGMECRGVTV